MGMDGVELVMGLEEEFGCSIPDSDAEKMATVGDVLNWLEKAAAEERLFSTAPRKPEPIGWFAKHFSYRPQ